MSAAVIESLVLTIPFIVFGIIVCIVASCLNDDDNDRRGGGGMIE